MIRSACLMLLLVAVTASVTGQTLEIQSGTLRARVASHDERFDGLSVTDNSSGRSLSVKEAFVIVLKDKTELRSTEMQLAPIADTSSVIDPHLALRRTEK